MARLTNTTIYGAANITGNVVTTGYAFDISANSGIVNLSNANTVSSVIFTNNGSYNGLAGVPSVIFSAPTTGGGTANANVLMRLAGTLAIGNVGFGYANGDYLYANTGQYLQPAQIQVTSNTATTYGTGGINGFSIISYGLYFSLPNANVIGGVPYITFANTTGSGAGANVSAGSSFTVNNVYFQTTGSGYVEQPTVTITGGSPSIAATAYAYVGSGASTVKFLSSDLYLSSPNGPVLRVSDNNLGTLTGYLQVSAGQGNGGVTISSGGTNPNTPIFLGSGGSGTINFYNGSSGNRHVQIPYVSSVVNYISLSGAVTGGTPTISAQGSDGNIFLNLNGKGSGGVRTQYYHIVGYGYNNYLSLSGNSTGGPVGITAAGSDANVALSLYTQGNAAVQITGNSSGYIPAANSIYVGNRVGFASSNNISVVYQTWNTTTNSLDVVYG
jgi:hypothetical protein